MIGELYVIEAALREQALRDEAKDIEPYEYFVNVLQRVKNHPPLKMGELTPRRRKELFKKSDKRSVLYLIDQMQKIEE